jgi:hypothetical protein
VVVERAQVAEDFAELVHLAVVLRDEIEQIGIEVNARSPHQRDCADQDTEDGDQFAVPEAELGESIENAVDQTGGKLTC